MSDRIKTLIGTVLVLLALGSIYTWSLFNQPFADKFDVNVNTVAFTFGLMSLCLALGGTVSGELKARMGLKNVVVLSAALIGLGLGLAAFAPGACTLYLTAGLLLGFGDGIGYMLALTNLVKYFPDNKGLISAVAIGAYGSGSLIFKAIDSYLLVNYSLEQAIMAWAILISAMTAIGSILIYDSSSGESAEKKSLIQVDYELFEVIKVKEYWMLSTMFLIDCMCGLYVLGVTSDIGLTLIKLDYQDAATAISVAAIANIVGRLVIGALADRLPRIRLIAFDQILSFIAIALLAFVATDKYMYYAAIAMIAFAFGGTITVYPTVVSDFFGLKNFTKNYGLLYLGFGVGSLLGFVIGSIFGGFMVTFMVIWVLLVVAIVLSFVVHLPKENELRAEHQIRKEEISKILHGQKGDIHVTAEDVKKEQEREQQEAREKAEAARHAKEESREEAKEEAKEENKAGDGGKDGGAGDKTQKV